MLYIIKNISSDNIVVGKTVFQPGSEVRAYDLEPFKKMVEKGYLQVTDVQNSSNEIYKNYVKSNLIETKPIIVTAEAAEHIVEPVIQQVKQVSVLETKDNVLNQAIKENLMEAFFNFFIDKNVSDKDLKLLKWFYKNIGVTSKVSAETLNLLENTEHYEDLAAVLLNNVYPELLDLYLIEKNDENKKGSLSY